MVYAFSVLCGHVRAFILTIHKHVLCLTAFKVAKFNQRTLGRMTTNLVKKYGLNEDEACPLLLEYRERGFLRHQTREFIHNKAVDEQTWADNVESLVR